MDSTAPPTIVNNNVKLEADVIGVKTEEVQGEVPEPGASSAPIKPETEERLADGGTGPEPIKTEALTSEHVKKEEEPGAADLEELLKACGAGPGPSSPSADPSGTAGTKDAAASSSAEPEPVMDPEELLKEFLSDVKDVDRDNEVNRILWAFKLNPYEKMNLRFDATVEEVKKQFRKVSLLVHPDKCKHPQASTAFEILGEAVKRLTNEDHRNFLAQVLDAAREEVRKERKKATKHDSLVRMSILLNEAGRQGVEAQWEQTEEFHEKWRIKGREYLAQTEWKKRKTIKRLKDEVAKSEVDHVEAKEKAKKQKQDDKEWEQRREDRVGGWRDFVTKKKGGSEEADDGKAKPKKTIGQLKPPKLKTNDDDKLYVQRPVTEQFRPSAQPPQQKQPQQMKHRKL